MPDGECQLLRGEDGRAGHGTIEDAVLGAEVHTWMPEEFGYAEFWPVVVTLREREVWLVREAEGGVAKVGLLRTEAWLAEQGIAAVGDRASLDLPEMGVSGEFQVLEIGELRVSTGVRRPGFGRVTGKFTFSKGRTFNLFIAGESQPIGVTGLHPIWSEDRKAWVEVRELKAGERVLVEGGTRVVVKVERRGEESVHNIEVEGEHCYRVGEQGVLVHNASAAYREMQVLSTNSPISVGRVYASLASAVRRAFKGNYLGGYHNLAALTYMAKGSGKIVRGRIPSYSFTTSIGTHAEDKLIESLIAFIKADKLTCVRITNLYTDRSPCKDCHGKIEEASAMYHLPKFNLYFLVNFTGDKDFDAKEIVKRYGVGDLNSPLR